MTTCDKIVPRLTAYLDGELADDDGSVVRGHLRECAACRQVARDEAALRDGLRVLAPVDPPASLWAGVQARLAAAEVADAHKPSWRRAVARWIPAMPSLRQLAAGSMIAAAAVVALSLRAHRASDAPAGPIASALPARPAPAPAPANVSVPSADDVTADLIAEPARTTASYAQAIEELMKHASEARSGWTDERKATFDARIAELRASVGRAGSGRARQRVQRDWFRYLQLAVVRDDLLVASGGPR